MRAAVPRAAFAAALLLAAGPLLQAAPPPAPQAPPAPHTDPAPPPVEPPPVDGDLARGAVTAKVVCAGQPEESYALYLPAAYDPGRAWPIVYALDPRAHGERPARLFAAAAERFGYVVASSHNSMSDGPLAPTVDAVKAMWNDTHRRLRLDDRQVYAAGFSGTVRAAILLGLRAPGTFAGIVAAAAGWPAGRPPEKTDGLPFFGTVGSHDFNYLEMMQLDDRLSALGMPHRIEVFDGTHQWMPPELATEALAWMTLAALRGSRRAADPALIESLFAPRLAAARALDAAGRPEEAARAFRELGEDFQGLPVADPAALAAAVRRSAELAALPAVAAAAKRRAARLDREQHDIAAALQKLSAAMQEPPGEAAALPRALAGLRIGELRTRAHGAADPEDRLAAQRLLNTLLGQTSFYLPRQYEEQKDGARAAFALEIAAEIDPDDPDIWYRLAAADVRQGRRKEALKRLDRAVASGFRDAARLAADTDFAPLRGDADFARLLARLH